MSVCSHKPLQYVCGHDNGLMYNQSMDCTCMYLYIHVALSQLIQNKFGDTALTIASQQGSTECATVLLKHKANVNYQKKVRLLYVHGQYG